jgi:hypothetical protein
MPEDVKDHDSLPLEVQDIVRSLVSAIRAIKLYPPNNPLYSQSVIKTHEVLESFLQRTHEFHVEVQKTYFSSMRIPVGKETQLNKTIAQDLFAKGMRDIIFIQGLTAKELLDFCETLALSSEESAMKGGISSILWERGTTHIKVVEAGLDDVLTTDIQQASDEAVSSRKKEPIDSRGQLVLGDLKTDPAGFGMGLLALAKQTKAEGESTEDRLFALYNEAGRKIGLEYPDQREALFASLAQSALSLEQPYRERLIAGKLYGELDAELVVEHNADIHQHMPNDLHEIVTGRFSKAWTVPQVTELLKKTSAKEVKPAAPPRTPASLTVVPISDDLIGIARELAEYTPEEMETLKAMGEKGLESDIVEAAVRTLIFLLPLVQRSKDKKPDKKELKLFSGVVRQLEDLQAYLLKQKDYDLAALIVRVFHIPVDPAFKPRLDEAIRKVISADAIKKIVNDLQTFKKGSPEYVSAYSLLLTAEREATEILLELLAEETKRSVRAFLMDILKDVGKNQMTLLGEHLSDGRWYFVRNVVNLLSQTKADHVVEFLQKVSDHRNIRIRQEVLKGLMSIGGKKAAALIAKFLNDKEHEIQGMAIHGLAGLGGIGPQEAKPLLAFLEGRRINMSDRELTLEAIKALGKIGGGDAEGFLTRYDRIRWWRSRKLQVELRAAALNATEEIKRRRGDV